VSKYLNERIQVGCRDGRAVWLLRDGRRLPIVGVAEHWREVGYWWEGESEKEFFEIVVGGQSPGAGGRNSGQRPVTSGRRGVSGERKAAGAGGGGRPYLIYKDLATGQWFLYKVFD
jgi:hypothetical protein